MNKSDSEEIIVSRRQDYEFKFRYKKKLHFAAIAYILVLLPIIFIDGLGPVYGVIAILFVNFIDIFVRLPTYNGVGVIYDEYVEIHLEDKDLILNFSEIIEIEWDQEIVKPASSKTILSIIAKTYKKSIRIIEASDGSLFSFFKNLELHYNYYCKLQSDSDDK